MTDDFALDFGDLVVEPEHLSTPEQILLVGTAGSGKSHSALTLTQVEGLYPVLYIDTEGSTIGVADKFDRSRLTVLRVKTHKELKTVLDKLLDAGDKVPYKSVVIDTIDAAQERAVNLLQSQATSNGFEVWSKVATWLTGNDNDGLMHKLKAAPFLSVVIVHTREEKSQSGAVIQKVKLSGSSKDVIASIPDMVLYQRRLQSKGNDGKVDVKTTVYTVGTKTFDQAKSRFDLPPVLEDATLADVFNMIRSKNKN